MLRLVKTAGRALEAVVSDMTRPFTNNHDSDNGEELK